MQAWRNLSRCSVNRNSNKLKKNEQTPSEKAEINSGLQLGQKITNRLVSEEIATKESIEQHPSKETILDILVKPMHQE